MSDHDVSPAAAKDEPILLAHESDGIREYDNPMPSWWTNLFWGTFFFSVLYAMYYMVGVGPGHSAEYDEEVAVFYQEQAARLGELKPDQPTMLGLMADPKMMQAGAGMFASNCAVCHAKDGGGGTGPNLCDDSYLHVKRVEDIFTVITQGVAAKGMAAWEKRFSESQRVLLSAYVAHLRGTVPAQPKPAQGAPAAPWPSAGAAPAAPAPAPASGPQAMR